jgi:hypothetical protein
MDVPIPKRSSIESKTTSVFYKPGREKKKSLITYRTFHENLQ